jgi:pyruvate dehydrogenase E1 component
MNQNHEQPSMPNLGQEGAAEGVLRGMHVLPPLPEVAALQPGVPRCVLLGSGAIAHEALAAARLLAAEFGVAATVASVTSWSELAREGQAAERDRLLGAPAATPWLQQQLAALPGPIVATSDWVRAVPEQLRAHLPAGRHYATLGTDGFGRSDTRAALRRFFEVDRYYVTVAALSSLADDGAIETKIVAEAIAKYGLDPNKPNPVKV